MPRLFFALILTLVVSAGWAAGNTATSPTSSIKGEVLEVKDVEAYTYLRLRTPDGETWAAVSKAPVKKGAQVTIENPTVMTNFESKTLKKTFDKIVFGNLAGAPAPAAAAGAAPAAAASGAAPQAGGGMGAMHAGMAKAVDVTDVKVPKATGPDARTVAEVVTGRADLKNKTVVVRGKVVKFTPEVMGKNWVHLRDGSGSAADNTNDVLVTTKDETKVGDVVVAKGVVHTDIDLGSGYSYKVLIEEATLQK